MVNNEIVLYYGMHRIPEELAIWFIEYFIQMHVLSYLRCRTKIVSIIRLIMK